MSSGSSITSPTVMRSNVNKRKRSEMPDFLEWYLLSKEARKSERRKKEECRREKEECREQRRVQQNDNNYLFGLGLIPTLRRLSPALQSLFKLKIHQLLHDAEFGQSSSAFFSSPVTCVLPTGHPVDPYKLWVLCKFLATSIDVYYMSFYFCIISVFFVFFYIQDIIENVCFINVNLHYRSLELLSL